IGRLRDNRFGAARWSDNQQVACAERGGPLQRCEEQGRSRAVAVGVVEQIAGGTVEDDPIVRIVCRCSSEEGIGVERAETADRGEHRIVERDLVAASYEVAERIDIA